VLYVVGYSFFQSRRKYFCYQNATYRLHIVLQILSTTIFFRM
jgi:hypothetical protein